MQRNNKFSLLFVSFWLLSLFIFPLSLFAATVPAPTLIEVIQVFGKQDPQPIITGLTFGNTEVMIYVNGEFVGVATINQIDNPVRDFYFKVSNSLSAGSHTVTAIARDRNSLLVSQESNSLTFIIDELAAPTLIAPNQNSVTGKVKPFITGLTKTNTWVKIWIDGVLNGQTDIVKDESGTANFAYRPFLNLAVGEHTAWAITIDEFGRESQVSNTLRFKIEEPLPAPTLFIPVVNEATNISKPFIVGLAKNDVTIQVFIDKKLNGEFKVENHLSDAANFAYRPFLPLTPGPHLIYTVAIDSRGKTSRWSNLMSYTLRQPQITEEAASETSEDIEVLSSEGVFNEPLKDLIVLARLFKTQGEVELTSEQLSTLEELLRNRDDLDASPEEIAQLEELLQSQKFNGEQLDGVLDEVNEILDQEIEAKDEEGGLINESRENQSKLKLNLVIFILFLLAVIVWIFWVNRELIKEKREQSDDPDSKSNKDQNTLKF